MNSAHGCLVVGSMTAPLASLMKALQSEGLLSKSLSFEALMARSLSLALFYNRDPSSDHNHHRAGPEHDEPHC